MSKSAGGLDHETWTRPYLNHDVEVAQPQQLHRKAGGEGSSESGPGRGELNPPLPTPLLGPQALRLEYCV